MVERQPAFSLLSSTALSQNKLRGRGRPVQSTLPDGVVSLGL